MLVDDSRLKLNENVRQKRARMTVKCHNCGAAVEISEADANCPYCRNGCYQKKLIRRFL